MDNRLTSRQVEIIENNIKTFGDDLRVSWLLDFDVTTGEWLKSGSIFLYVHNAIQHRHYDYPTSLGHYDNPEPTLLAVRKMVYGFEMPFEDS